MRAGAWCRGPYMRTGGGITQTPFQNYYSKTHISKTRDMETLILKVIQNVIHKTFLESNSFYFKCISWNAKSCFKWLQLDWKFPSQIYNLALWFCSLLNFHFKLFIKEISLSFSLYIKTSANVLLALSNCSITATFPYL